MNTVERHSRRRSTLLILNALALIAWQATEISLIHRYFEEGYLALLPPTLIILWFITLLALLLKPAERIFRQQLEDELTQHNRRSAMIAGYWSVMMSTGLALVAAGTVQVEAIDIARANLIVGASVPMLVFAFLERFDGVGQ
ncbi:MAG TPA: hypothetical protein VGN60_01365 [Devosia sp.]|jgi:hypothetical protein|nr:hypothetical protein [Devosia sp.]